MCNKSPRARYISLYIDAHYVNLFFGLCVPKQCKAEDMNTLKEDVTNEVNNQLAKLGMGDSL